MPLTRWRIFWIVLLFWGIIFLPSLGKIELKSEEGRRVLPAVNMIQTGNWIVPSVGGEDYYNKPPGINWLVAISFILTGEQSEFTARLPSALFILIFVSLLIWMPSDFLSLSGRFIAAVVFFTNFSMIEKGRLIEIEAVYVCLTAIAVLWWLNVWSRGGSKWSLWIVPSLILAYGMLVKGPFILFFFYFTVIAALLYDKRFKDLFSIQHLLGIIIILIIPLIWTYLAFQQTEGSKMTGQMTSQLLIRIFRFPNPGRLAVDTLRALVNFLPWLLFIPVLWNKKNISLIQQKHLPLFKACRLSLLVTFFVIDLLPGGEPRYTMPAIPLAAILVGWTLSLHEEFSKEDKIWKNILLVCFLLSCLITAAGLILVTRLPVAYTVSVITICITIIVFYKRMYLDNTFKLVLVTGLLTSVVMLQYAVFASSIIKRYESHRPVAVAVNEIVPAGQTIYVLKPGYQLFLFYVRPPLKYLLQDDQISDDVHYLLVEKPSFERLQTQPQFSSRSPVVIYEPSEKIRESDYRLVKMN
jgi:4-amino-4-deoxy-L-arabinose transferase-like glycosyltransferase